MHRFAAGVLLVASVQLSAPSALADDPAAAQALFADARKLMSAGKFEDACPKLEESQRLSPATGTKFNLADCYQHTGRLASAWAAFLSVAASAKNANQGAREKAARDRAAALEPKLSRLAVVVPDSSQTSGLVVTRDGESVGDAEWGASMPLDPGQHTVTASAPGKHPWKAVVEIGGAGSTAKVIVPMLDDEPAPPPPPAPTIAPPDTSSPATSTPAQPASSAPSKTPGWVLLGVGGAAVVGGAITWALRGSTVSKLQNECGPSGTACPSGAAGDISTGKTYDALGVTLFAVGGACALAGVSWLLLSGSHGDGATAQLVPALGPHAGGLRLQASF